MLCPNCGTKTTTDHRFCRNCGMNLEPVSRALAAHLSVGGAAAAARARAAGRRNVQPLTGGLLGGVFVVIFGLLLIAFLPGKAFKFLGVASALIGITTTMVVMLSMLRRMNDARAEAPPPALDHTAPDTGRLLHEQTFDHVPSSITDHTTELLGAEVKEKKSRQGN